MNKLSSTSSTAKKRSIVKKILIFFFTGVIALAIAAFIAFKVSPWPSALLIRAAFTIKAEKVNRALEKHVPSGIVSILNQQYDRNDKDALLDVYFPAAVQSTGQMLPVIVWIHGGGWVSGKKEEVANYCKILAGKGYTVVAIDYAIAPEKKYPTPLRQTNAALGYLAGNARRLHINASCFILAGDSGGASIAAQVANLISVPAYSRILKIEPAIRREQLAGLLLYCGPYDIRDVDLNSKYSAFLEAVLWSYSGGKDFMTNPEFATLSVVDYVNADFPPAFISAGNGDPLAAHSQSLARALSHIGVKVDTLFFPPDYKPAQPHEYQFNLDSNEGRLALERSLEFLSELKSASGNL